MNDVTYIPAKINKKEFIKKLENQALFVFVMLLLILSFLAGSQFLERSIFYKSAGRPVNKPL
jgi:hypothetical protein